MGLTPFFCKTLYDVTGSTPSIPIAERFQSAPLYLVWGLVAICFLWMKYTPTGLWVSFAGEHPEALDKHSGKGDAGQPESRETEPAVHEPGAQEQVEEAGFADVRAADNRDLDVLRAGRFRRLVLRKARRHVIQQGVHANPVLRRERKHVRDP